MALEKNENYSKEEIKNKIGRCPSWCLPVFISHKNLVHFLLGIFCQRD